MWRSAMLSRPVVSVKTSRQSDWETEMNKVLRMLYFAQLSLAQTPGFGSLNEGTGKKVYVRMEVSEASSFSSVFLVSLCHPPTRTARISCGWKGGVLRPSDPGRTGLYGKRQWQRDAQGSKTRSNNRMRYREYLSKNMHIICWKLILNDIDNFDIDFNKWT